MSLPNILYLHSHDTGRQIEPYGAPIATPNLMSLAKLGTTFRQAFCVASSCSASRASLLTGRYPHQNGMTGLAHRGWHLNDYNQTLVSLLKQAGYLTGLIGEHHIAPNADTGLIGFDKTFLVGNYSTDEISTAAIDWIKPAKPHKQPWFLSCGFWDTHRTNYPPLKDDAGKYGTVLSALPDKPEYRRDFAAFQAAVQRLDGGIGRVLKALAESGQAENTLVIATTDHAPGFPDYKANVTDKGLGVFLIIAGLETKGMQVYEDAVTHLDILPTICELTGIKVPSWAEGKSLQHILAGSSQRLHRYVFGETNYHAAYEPQRTIRSNRYRYAERYDQRQAPVLPNIDDGPTKAWKEADSKIDQKYLFDLVNDPLEKVNLADRPEFADVQSELQRELADWQGQTSDPLLNGPLELRRKYAERCI